MSKTVTFQEDIFPHVRGDVVKLEKDELDRVDAVAKARGLSEAYVVGAKQIFDAVDNPGEADHQRAVNAREGVRDNEIATAATLEAQRNSVAEPASVDSLGVIPETPAQVVTGTEPVAGVEVENPQEVTDPGSDAEPEVKAPKPNK